MEKEDLVPLFDILQAMLNQMDSIAKSLHDISTWIGNKRL